MTQDNLTQEAPGEPGKGSPCAAGEESSGCSDVEQLGSPPAPEDLTLTPEEIEHEAKKKKWREQKRQQTIKKKREREEAKRAVLMAEVKAELEKNGQLPSSQEAKLPPTREELQSRVSSILGHPEPVVLDSQEVKQLATRIDGKLKGSKLSPEFKRAIQIAYESNLGIDADELAKACGIGKGTVIGAVGDAPGLAQRVSQKRQLAVLEDLERGLAAMSKQFREAAEAGQIPLDDKHLRDFSIMYGIMTDKRQLLAGKSTQNVEVRAHLTIEERKARMLEVLDRAKGTVRMLQAREAKGDIK